MGKYSVRLYPRAFDDIDNIYSYIAIDKKSPENAKNQTDRIWENLISLGLFPRAHQERLEGRFAGCGYRQFLIDNFLVVYRIDDIEKIVYVITIQYQKRDI